MQMISTLYPRDRSVRTPVVEILLEHSCLMSCSNTSVTSSHRDMHAAFSRAIASCRHSKQAATSPVMFAALAISTALPTAYFNRLEKHTTTANRRLPFMLAAGKARLASEAALIIICQKRYDWPSHSRMPHTIPRGERQSLSGGRTIQQP